MSYDESEPKKVSGPYGFNGFLMGMVLSSVSKRLPKNRLLLSHPIKTAVRAPQEENFSKTLHFDIFSRSY